MLKNTNYKDIELLSEEVHKAWMAEKFKQGFHAPDNCNSMLHDAYKEYGPDYMKAPPKEPKFYKWCEKCHTDLYPYQELPDNIKEYDRVTVAAVLQALNKVKGYNF